MSEPKNANEIITQAAIRWYGPAFTLGSAGFGGFILEELKANGYAVVELPEPESDDYGDRMVKVALTSDSPSAKQAKIRIEDRGFGPELFTTCVPNPLKVADGVAYAASILSAVAAAARRNSEER